MSEALVDQVYECALQPDLWPEVLGRLANIAGARGGLLLVASPQVTNWTASADIHDDVRHFASGDLILRSLRLPRVLGAENGGFLRDLDILSEAELVSDPMYTEFLRPRGLGWAAGFGVALPTGDSFVLSLERAYGRGPVETAAIERLNALRPHLARSAFLAARLHLERAHAASAVLALIGLPAMVLSGNGKVQAANELLPPLDDYFVWGACDCVALRDVTSDRLLRAALACAADASRDAPMTFPVRTVGRGAAMVAHVIPVRGTARDVFAGSASVLVVTPVALPKAPAASLIRSLFDLTPAETRVAQGLAGGISVQAIAAAGRVSIETVRSQVKSVLGKTGCQRQGELVALLGGLRLGSGQGVDRQIGRRL